MTNHFAGVGGVDGAVGADGTGIALPPRILNITTPQVGHLPLIALRPFFMTSSTASAISFFALHFTQYPSGIKISQLKCLTRRVSKQGKLTSRQRAASTGKT